MTKEQTALVSGFLFALLMILEGILAIEKTAVPTDLHAAVDLVTAIFAGTVGYAVYSNGSGPADTPASSPPPQPIGNVSTGSK